MAAEGRAGAPLLLALALALFLGGKNNSCKPAYKARHPGARFCGAPGAPRFRAHTPASCKELHLVRHAEGLHNEAERNARSNVTGEPGTWVLLEEHSGRRFWDARLTSRGRRQCAELRRRLLRQPSGPGSVPPEADGGWAALALELDLVVVSPMTRTLQTASLALGQADAPGAPPFVATELARERIGPYTCDARRPLAELRADFPAVDFSGVRNEHDELYVSSKEHGPGEDGKMRRRVARLLTWIMRRRERRIAVVAHKHTLKYMLALTAREGELTSVLDNCELRSLTLCDESASGGTEEDEEEDARTDDFTTATH
eukprot:g7209.t1